MIYYFESLGKDGFNIWQKDKNRYYNIAGLLWGQFDVTEIEKAVSYNSKEIKDEIEGPLIKLSFKEIEILISMKNGSIQEIKEYIKKIIEKK